MQFVNLVFTVYIWLIIIRVILSWCPVLSGEFFKLFCRFVYDATEPTLAFFRKILPSMVVGSMGLDLSPIIVIFVLQFLRWLILTIIGQFFIYI